MLTRTGWSVLIGAAALVLAGRVLGAFELYLLGAGVAALVVVAMLAVNLSRLQVGLARSVVPPRVHVGGTARVELRMVNHAQRRTPAIRLHDAVTGTRGANLLISPLSHAEQTRAAYQLPTAKRGALAVGPLDIVVGDPFGLCESRTTGLDVAHLVVYPRIDELVPLEHSSSHDPQAMSRRPNALGRVGDDFYALRPYVVGDDLRRVHWPSVARTGELMIRQHELPWQERTTVLLDVRSQSHTEATFERAVSAAASILVTAHGDDDQVRLCSTDGGDSGFGLGRAHLDALLHHLALLRTDSAASLQVGLDNLARTASGGSLVIVAAGLGTADLNRLSTVRRRFGTLATVVFDDPDLPVPGGARVDPASTYRSHLVCCGPDADFAALWNQSSLSGTGRGAPATSSRGGSTP